MNVVIVGDSVFSWELAMQLRGQIRGRLYFVLPDPEKAMDASLERDIVAIRGDVTDTDVLDQIELAECYAFVAGSREEEGNVLSALYALNKGASKVYARVFEAKFVKMLESLGVVPIQTSHMAASSMAISILKPAVADLVSLTRGQFALEEIRAGEFPELVGCKLGHLQGERLHIIAVARANEIRLSYNTLVEQNSKLIIVYDESIRRRLRQELHAVAAQAAQRAKL